MISFRWTSLNIRKILHPIYGPSMSGHGRGDLTRSILFLGEILNMNPTELYKTIERRRQLCAIQDNSRHHPAVDAMWKKTLHRLDKTLFDKSFLRAATLFGEGWGLFCGPL